jgi:hypothetical protein
MQLIGASVIQSNDEQIPPNRVGSKMEAVDKGFAGVIGGR